MKNFIIICQGVLTLFGLMICGLFVTNIIGLLPLEGDAHQWLIFSGQNIFAFILPPLLIWKMQFKTSPLNSMGGEDAPTWRWFLIMLLIYFAAMPALNQIVFWNQEVHLPESMSGFEDWCRRMEKLAEDQTSGLLDSTDISTTVMNIFVIGVLTGIGEEFFFRGGLQRILTYCKVNHHVAIWTTAIVFSALHFQFFGFVPRVLLGALFGYLY
ncbi:MAG: CPBP family intramembrane metalloprotease, partial [Muribaculaceae bacterium]|nr:CPBP family intramembrane metalloprotease [Muribaculaceae bacterium]